MSNRIKQILLSIIVIELIIIPISFCDSIPFLHSVIIGHIGTIIVAIIMYLIIKIISYE